MLKDDGTMGQKTGQQFGRRYSFQWMNLERQFESCVAVCSRNSRVWRFLEHIFHTVPRVASYRHEFGGLLFGTQCTVATEGQNVQISPNIF